MEGIKSKNESRKRLIIIITVSSFIILILVFAAKNKFSTRDSINSITYNENLSHDSFAAAPLPQKNSNEYRPSKTERPVSPINQVTQQIQDDSIEKYTIKTGNLNIKVFSLTESLNSISQIARSHGGDIISTNINPQSNFGFLTLQVKVDKFEHALDSIKNISSLVENESISTSDATRQVVDLNATLKNKKAQEDRLRDFFERAENVNDLLAIEKNLTAVRGEIGIIEARLKSLLNQTSFSKITINVTEDVEILPSQNDWRPSQVAKNAVNSLLKKIQNIIDSTIDISISSLPIFILSLLGLWILYTITKKVFKFLIKKPTKPTVSK